MRDGNTRTETKVPNRWPLPIGSQPRDPLTVPCGYIPGKPIQLRSRSNRSTAPLERHPNMIQKSETTPAGLGGRHDPHSHIRIRALPVARYESC